MPPRAKNTGEPALVALLKEAGVHNAKDINDSTLRKIYKLEDDVPARRSAAAGSSSNSGGVDNYFTRSPIHTFKACDNAWNTADKRREALAREAARTGKAGQKKKLKAAQSDSEDGHSALDPSCTFARCRDNPRCLNWLGQAAWEEREQSIYNTVLSDHEAESASTSPCSQGSREICETVGLI